jgi:hypothetical protein
MLVTVCVKNIGGDEVRLRSTPERSWMDFFVKTHDGLSVQRQKPFQAEDQTLKPGQALRLEVDLAPHFLIRDPGAYRIQLCVHGPTGEPWLTEPLELAAARGETVWSRERGLQEERRIFSLVRFFEGPGLGVYLLVDLPAQHTIFPARRLGSFVPMSRPVGEFDTKNHLHLMFPVGSGRHRIVVVNQDGEVLRQETRQEAPSAPQLRLTPDGQVVVEGGLVILPENLRERLSYLQSRLGGGQGELPANP